MPFKVYIFKRRKNGKCLHPMQAFEIMQTSSAKVHLVLGILHGFAALRCRNTPPEAKKRTFARKASKSDALWHLNQRKDAKMPRSGAYWHLRMRRNASSDTHWLLSMKRNALARCIFALDMRRKLLAMRILALDHEEECFSQVHIGTETWEGTLKPGAYWLLNMRRNILAMRILTHEYEEECFSQVHIGT